MTLEKFNFTKIQKANYVKNNVSNIFSVFFTIEKTVQKDLVPESKTIISKFYFDAFK